MSSKGSFMLFQCLRVLLRILKIEFHILPMHKDSTSVNLCGMKAQSHFAKEERFRVQRSGDAVTAIANERLIGPAIGNRRG